MKHRAWLKPSGTPQIHRTKCLCQLKKAQLTITSKLPPTYETISPAQPTKLEPREVTSFYFLTNANSLERFLHSDLLEFLSSEPNRIFRHTRHLPIVWSPGKNFRETYWVCASITFPCFSTCKIQILNLAHLKEPAPPTSSPLSFLYQTQGTNTGAVAAGGKIARTVAFPTNLQASSSSIWLPWDRAIIPPCPPGPGETGPLNTQYSSHGWSMVFNPFNLLYKSWSTKYYRIHELQHHRKTGPQIHLFCFVLIRNDRIQPLWEVSEKTRWNSLQLLHSPFLEIPYISGQHCSLYSGE